MMYSDKVWDHFSNPRNVGEIADADGVGEVGNAKCGDIMKIYLKVSDDGIIEAAYNPEKKFAMGFQWHPEYLGLGDSVSEKIFCAFVDACRGE